MQFILQVDLIVAAVSLFTILMLWVLGVPVPSALIAVFLVSVLLMFITIVIDRIIKYTKRK